MPASGACRHRWVRDHPCEYPQPRLGGFPLLRRVGLELLRLVQVPKPHPLPQVFPAEGQGVTPLRPLLLAFPAPTSEPAPVAVDQSSSHNVAPSPLGWRNAHQAETESV